MAGDIFLKIESIKGEAQDDEHKEEIDILSWSWGASQSCSAVNSADIKSHRCNIENVSLTKRFDKSSPKLLNNLLMPGNPVISEAILTVRKAGSTPINYLVLKMKNVVVSNISTGLPADSEDLVTETISLNFESFQLAYQEQGADGGISGGLVVSSWDIGTNKAVYKK